MFSKNLGEFAVFEKVPWVTLQIAKFEYFNSNLKIPTRWGTETHNQLM